MSFTFPFGIITVLIPQRWAAIVFSFKPPIGRTLPRSVTSPVIAKSALTGTFANEETKSGFTVEEAPLALELAQRFANIKVKGIMTIGAHSEDEALIRKSFQQAHDFYTAYQKKYQLDTLSMGMSNDYPLALEYGTTLIRVGSKIFGERQYNQ